MPQQSSPGRPQDRIIRVFISSTFRDMHAERDWLVRFTFPELKEKCRESRFCFGPSFDFGNVHIELRHWQDVFAIQI